MIYLGRRPKGTRNTTMTQAVCDQAVATGEDGVSHAEPLEIWYSRSP
jgi:hypothetical protein